MLIPDFDGIADLKCKLDNGDDTANEHKSGQKIAGDTDGFFNLFSARPAGDRKENKKLDGAKDDGFNIAKEFILSVDHR